MSTRLYILDGVNHTFGNSLSAGHIKFSIVKLNRVAAPVRLNDNHFGSRSRSPLNEGSTLHLQTFGKVYTGV